MDDEEYVRSKWKRIEMGGPYVAIWPNVGDYEDVCANFGSWESIAVFTRAREQQIREVQEEIDVLTESAAIIVPEAGEVLIRKSREDLRAELQKGKRGLKAPGTKEGQ